MSLDIDLLDYLRLEVETDPTGLVNKVANPSGELGGWGWVTPAGNSYLEKYNDSLLYHSPTPAAASWFYTEAIAISAGQYAAASWYLVAVSGYYRVKFEWLNSAGAVLSSSAQTGYLNTAGAVSIGPYLAPASTAYVRLRFDHYSTNAGANPTAGSLLQFNLATVATAATSGALGSSRTNLLTNPDLETNATGWAADPGTTIARVTTQHDQGTASLSFKATTGTTGVKVKTSAYIGVTAGVGYSFSLAVKGSVAGAGLVVGVEWYSDTTGDPASLISTTSNAVHPYPVTAAWARYAVAVTAPAGAAYAKPIFGFISASSANTYYADSLLFELTQTGPFPVTYFDGSTAAGSGWTYAWSGTAHASTSVASSANLAYLEPIPYVDILGASASLEVNRKALDVGVIQALVKDASLDPAVADTIRPGRAVRLRCLNDDTAAWDVLAQGILDKGRVTYDLRKPAAKQATITLATVDANQVLANTNRPDGVASIPDLPYVLEGARIPWNVNGSGDQVASATVASRNDQASALDQVILARDSDLGYAWTTKEGVLTAYDDRTLDYYGTGTVLLDESVYSGLDVSFDVSDCINEVMVNYRRFNSATAEVEEVPFGPYRDAASVEEWGVHQATFTVHGIGEANVAAYAASILAANAQPSRRINSVTIPIRSAADLVEARALIDLYAKVRVTNTDKALDQTLRPTGIQHQISPRRWTMVLTFDQVDTVATPIPTTPQGGSDADLEGVWIAPSLTNSWVNYGAPYALAGYMRKNGIVYLQGLVKLGAVTGVPIFTLPPGFRPAGALIVDGILNNRIVTTGAASAGTAHTHPVNIGDVPVRINIGTDGTIGISAAGSSLANGYLSLSGISFPAEA